MYHTFDPLEDCLLLQLLLLLLPLFILYLQLLPLPSSKPCTGASCSEQSPQPQYCNASYLHFETHSVFVILS